MSMKLRDIRPLGRYQRPDGKEVNVKKGTQVGRSVSWYFYLFRNERVYIDQAEFYKDWKKVKP